MSPDGENEEEERVRQIENGQCGGERNLFYEREKTNKTNWFVLICEAHKYTVFLRNKQILKGINRHQKLMRG